VLRYLEPQARTVLEGIAGGSAPIREELQLLEEYYDILLQEGQYARAAQAMDQLARALERFSADPALSAARAAALQHRLVATVRAQGPRAGLLMARDPELRRAVAVHPAVLLNYLNITSVAALAAGDFDQAYRSLMEEEPLAAGSPGAHHGNLALYLRQVGAFPESYDAATRALGAAYAAEDYGGAVADMFHLANAALAMGRTEEALDWVSRAVGLARAVGDGELTGAALGIGAQIALRYGAPQIALRLLDEAVLCMGDRAWDISRATILLGYARALDAAGRAAHAEQAYRAAARVAARTGSLDRVAALHGLSRLAERRGDAGAAVAYAESAFAAVVQGRLSIGAEPHKFSFLGDKEAVAERLFGLARRRGADPAWLLDRVEQSKMQVFLDLYGAPGGVRERRGIGGELRAALGPGDLLLDYVVGDSVSFVLSVTRRDGVRVHDLRARRGEIRALVAQVHAHMDLRRGGSLRAIRRDRPPRELRAALRRLYALLLADVPLSAGTRRLIVVPDGSVAGLPWPALLDGGGRPLVERMEVAQLPSVPLALDRMRQVRAGAPGGRPRALVVGVLDGVPAERVRDAVGFAQGPAWTPRALPPLAGGSREARTIGGALTGMEVRYLLDRGSRRGAGSSAGAPTPANVLASLPTATVVHFIAHGVFNARAPMRSVLFLQADSAGGTLAAADFLGRPLPGLQLVVLSACQTGVSATMPGGEPVGFVRGVLGAGAASVVLTEWEVDDAATADLFTAFYTHLRSDTRGGALRKAQLEVMRRRRHPFYWAGVTLHGDWRELEATLPAR
jgi:CHAT domain-containing protein/tetratricopeptide (TPR) repeat protein